MRSLLTSCSFFLVLVLALSGVVSCSSGGGTGDCSSGRTMCSEQCVDVTADPRNCGTCSAACSAGQVCQGSLCTDWGDCTQNPCPGFSYCNSATKQCVAGCTVDSQCGTDETCEMATHQCIYTRKDGGGGGDQPVCNEVHFDSQAVPPNMLLVLDKSGSMREDAGNVTKMAALKVAVSGLLDQGDGKIRFGLMVFPSDSSCGPGGVSVECSDTSIDTIRTRVNGLSSNGGTPTGESLGAADAYQGLHDTTRRNFVLLVTDGIPTCPNADGQMPPNSTQQELDLDAALALQAVQTLHSHGIDTFVIGLGDGTASNPTLLNDMANAGGQPRAGDPKYYQADDQAELQEYFTTIGGMVLGCNLALGERPEYPKYLWVYFNGVPVPKDTTHTNGWDYDATNNQINFYGGYCDQLRTGAVTNVDIKMGCAPPT